MKVWPCDQLMDSTNVKWAPKKQSNIYERKTNLLVAGLWLAYVKFEDHGEHMNQHTIVTRSN
jgi:hypothetical protein